MLCLHAYFIRPLSSTQLQSSSYFSESFFTWARYNLSVLCARRLIILWFYLLHIFMAIKCEFFAITFSKAFFCSRKYAIKYATLFIEPHVFTFRRLLTWPKVFFSLDLGRIFFIKNVKHLILRQKKTFFVCW